MNWFLKLLLGVLLWAVAGVFGWQESYRLRLRVKQLEQLESIFQIFETEIRFGLTPISLILEHHRETYSFLETCSVFLSKGMSFSSAWKQTILKTTGLRTEEKQLLLEFGNSFGKSDPAGQTELCGLTRCHLKRLREEAVVHYRSKGKLYRSLGFFCGAGIILVLM